MRIEKKNKNDERRILTAMIVDDLVLGRISNKWPKREGLFKTKWANVVAGWCLTYFKRYERAPLKDIETLYEAWSTKIKDETTLRLVEKFLETLSKSYKKLAKKSNTDYIIDLAGVYFNTVKLERLNSTIEGHLDSGRSDDAHDEVVAYSRIDLGIGEGINVVQDKQAIKEAFKAKEEALIKYPGALGKFLKDAFERDGFVAFMAPEKRGKSFCLLDAAYRAMLQGRKVAFFEAGDMSQNQVMRRLMTRISGRPLKRCLVNKPIGISKEKEEKMATVETKRLRFKEKLTYKQAWKACQELTKMKLKTEEPLFRLSCHANSTLSIRMIRGILLDWEQEDWIPDVIIIDYADILNMESQGLEGRDRINEVWKQMRGLSQSYHCLLLTATQANAGSYEKTTMKKKDFSEDKRKHAHVTGMLGINQTDDEKEEQIMRLNWIDLREQDYNEKHCVHVACCLALAQPFMKSCK